MRKKKIFSLITAFCLVAGSIPVYALSSDSFSVEETEDVLAETSSDALKTQEALPKLLASGHYYDEDHVSFSWSSDLSSCTVTFTCTDCGESEEVEAKVTCKETEEATCTEDGTYTYTASASIMGSNGTTAVSDVKTAVSEATGHNFVYSSTQPADCENEGYDRYVCSGCQAFEKRNVQPALGHYYRDDTDSDGNYKYIDIKWNSGEGTCDVAFNCAEQGCGHQEVISLAAEDLEYTVLQEASCEAEGSVLCSLPEISVESRTGTVSVSGTFTLTTQALGHDYRDYDAINFVWDEDTHSCTVSIICSDCGVRDHVYPVVVRSGSEPDCSQDGTYVYTAEVTLESRGETVTRSDSITESVSAKGHDYDGEHVEFIWDGSSCTALFTCIDCGKTAEGVCEVTETDRLDPDCVNAGYVSRHADASMERRSGAVVLVWDDSTEILEALGHVYDNGVITTPPACVTAGVKTFTCLRCGSFYTEYVEALGHSFDDGVVTLEPSCEEPGVKTFTCSGCGEFYTEEIPATGHSWKETVTEPSCEEEGSYVYTCENCGRTETVVIDKLGHLWDVESVTAPTCLEEGFSVYRCAREGCEASKVEDIKEPLGHLYDEGKVTLEPTGTEEGVKTYTCVRCGETKEESIPAIGTAVLRISVVYNTSYATGVVFELYDEEGNLLGGYQQGSEPSEETLTLGTYTIKITVKNGYTFTDTEYTLSLSEDTDYEIPVTKTVSRSSSSGGSSGSSSRSSSTVTPSTVTVPDGSWTYFEDTDKWTLNSFAYKNTWVYAYNPYAQEGQEAYDWFHFDSDGYMNTGWFTDTDGNVYYLNPSLDGTRGKMVTGWAWIGRRCYYFNEKSDGTKGAMYKSAVTPDGYTVDSTGAWYVNDSVIEK